MLLMLLLQTSHKKSDPASLQEICRMFAIDLWASCIAFQQCTENEAGPTQTCGKSLIGGIKKALNSMSPKPK